MSRGRRYMRPTNAATQPIDALIVGHVTRDLLPDGDWRPGGAAFYAGVTATRLGLRVGIVTSAPADLCERVAAELDDAPMVVVDSETATTFENVYTPAGRTQYLRSSAHALTREDIPSAWRSCDLALLAPVAGECALALASELQARIVAAAPQGWLRRTEADGRVRPRMLADDEVAALSSLSALILSREDLTGPAADVAAQEAADETLATWARLVPLLAVTRGAEGADLWRAGRFERLSGYPAREVDPTGAGDVFAAALLCALASAQSDPVVAIDYANRVAALSVEGIGPSSIPTLAQVAARYLDRT